MDKFWSKTLTRKMIRLVLLGFCAAISLFFVIFFTGNALLGEYFSSSDFIYNAETPYINKLQAFIQEEHVAATDTSRLREWAQENGAKHLTVSRNRFLIYDSAYSDSVVFEQTEVESLHYNWLYFHSVSFADGDADVFIYANYETKYYLFFYMADVFLCAFLWIILFSLGIRREVIYIRQLSHGVTQIELGSLGSEIPVKGNDELGCLANGLNQMRLALIEKEEKEKEMKASQDSLVLGMAHDLRTPLTGLMAFLEIARKQDNLENCVKFVDKAYVKTEQLRDLSNQLFELFLINSEQPLHLEAPENVEYAAGEYLSELCSLLEIEGYQVSYDDLHWEPVQIQICADYMGRIIDNLISNIKKYADPKHPVYLSVTYSTEYVSITLRNKPAQLNQYIHGTGIGVKNIHSMMSQMNGSCNVNIETNNYTITLNFPIVQPISAPTPSK